MKHKSVVPTNKKNIKTKFLTQSDTFEFINDFLKKKSTVILFSLLLIELISSYLLFDLKMTAGGDDSFYILNAFNFVHDFTYPGQFEGALYPFFISIFIKFLGVNIPFLKSLSYVCMFIFFIVFYLSYKNRIPTLLLFATILIISFNSHLLYYASQTYTEAFFLVIQGSLFLVMNKFFIDKEKNSRTNFVSIILLGFILFLLTISKNLGLGCYISVIAFFLLVWQWKDALLVTGSFGIFYFLFEVFKRIIWSHTDFQIKSQGTGLLYKDFYNPSKGYEDFSGFVDRITGNSNGYISKDLYTILGLRTELTELPSLTIFTYCLFFITIYVLFKKNKYLLFAGVYSGVMLFITFITIQKMWSQERLILIFVPYLVLFFLGGIYYLLKNKDFSKVQFVFFMIVAILLITSFNSTSKVIKTKRIEFSANLKNDPYKGFNEGMANFIKMSKWASENTAQDKIIMSRKPEISFTYTGRKFFGINRVPNISNDSLFSIIKKDTQSVYYSILNKDFYTNNGQNIYNIYYDYQKYCTACILGSGTNDLKADEIIEYEIFKLPKNKVNDFIIQTTALKIPIVQDIKDLVETYKNKNYMLSIFQPDVLLDWLQQNHVSYIIMANFALTDKLNPDKRDYVTTVQKYIRYTEMKYPIFKEIHNIGEDPDKSAKLIEVDYTKIPK